jgi:hypothetical protein
VERRDKSVNEEEEAKGVQASRRRRTKKIICRSS